MLDKNQESYTETKRSLLAAKNSIKDFEGVCPGPESKRYCTNRRQSTLKV